MHSSDIAECLFLNVVGPIKHQGCADNINTVLTHGVKIYLHSVGVL